VTHQLKTRAASGPPSTAAADRTRRRRRRVLAATAAVVVAVVFASLAYAVFRRATWQTVWSEDFTGAAGTAPSSASWRYDTGTGYPGGAPQWGTGEVQSYTADRAEIALDGEGHLRITPTRDEAGAWRSARIESRRQDFRPPAGGTLAVEAKIKISDGGQGYWPAFWMLGEGFRDDPTAWPGIGEIDILENIGREPGIIHGTLHCGVAPGGPCQENTGLGGAYTSPDGTPMSARFHTYSVQWDRSAAIEEIRWYVDGHQYHVVRASDVDAATWARATGHGFFLLLNVAIGGSWPGLPDASTRPGSSMLVDSVSVSQRG
jgi:beta-glucanase (GH16 family)